ncbi:hypothetical protein DFQ29_003491, partial [Apophysomyces sp. BC1021]
MCLDLDKYDFRRADNRQLFRNQILSDGFSVHLQFSRTKRPKSVVDEEIKVGDLRTDAINEFFRPVAIDPGVRHLFTASYDYGSGEHEIRRCSTPEYYALTGSARRNHDLDKKKQASGVKLIESEFPTAKTANRDQYREYLQYFFAHGRTLFDFYNASRGQERFYNYQGRQRAKAEIANILINGGRKYNRQRRKNTKRNRRARKMNRHRKKRKQARLRQQQAEEGDSSDINAREA